jgi:prevent-host-death family protein
VRQEPLSEAAGHLDQLADEVEKRRARIVLTRPGHADVVLLSVDELESLEETLFWMRDEEERAAEGEAPGDGEQGARTERRSGPREVRPPVESSRYGMTAERYRLEIGARSVN